MWKDLFDAVRVTEEGKGSHHSRVGASTTGVHVWKKPYKEEVVVPSQQTKGQWSSGVVRYSWSGEPGAVAVHVFRVRELARRETDSWECPVVSWSRAYTTVTVAGFCSLGPLPTPESRRPSRVQ